MAKLSPYSLYTHLLVRAGPFSFIRRIGGRALGVNRHVCVSLLCCASLCSRLRGLALSRASFWKLSAWLSAPALLSPPLGPMATLCHVGLGVFLGFTTLCLRFGFWIFYRTTVIYLGQCARPRVLSPAGAAPRTPPFPTYTSGLRPAPRRRLAAWCSFAHC